MHYLSIKYTQEVTNLAFWEKDKYLTITTAPSTHYTIIKAGSMMATSVVSEELGLIYKGDASINDITEAESNEQTIWDGIW